MQGRPFRAAGECRLNACTCTFQGLNTMRVDQVARSVMTTVFVVVAAASLVAAGKSDVADAMMKGDTAALRTLVQRKADVNAPQVDGATALHWAVYRDDVESADLVITAGARGAPKNPEGGTPRAVGAPSRTPQKAQRPGPPRAPR